VAAQELSLELLTEELTVRELIRSRIYQEVQDFNRRQADGKFERFRGLVEPTETEIMLNGYEIKTPRQIDWKTQFEKACEAFERNRILILLNDRQLTDLEETITLTQTSSVVFLKLVPLVGG